MLLPGVPVLRGVRRPVTTPKGVRPDLAVELGNLDGELGSHFVFMDKEEGVAGSVDLTGLFTTYTLLGDFAGDLKGEERFCQHQNKSLQYKTFFGESKVSRVREYGFKASTTRGLGTTPVC